MKLNKIAMTGVLSLAGLGLVGAGAHAVFTSSTTSIQTVSAAGAPNVTLSATCAPNPAPSGEVSPPALSDTGSGQDVGTACGYTTNSGTTMNLPSVTGLGSSFVTGETDITMTNNGNLPAAEVTLQVSDTPTNTITNADTSLNGNVFASEIYVCLTSDGFVMYNGPMQGLNDGLLGAGESTITLDSTPYNYITPNGGTDMYGVVFYAGTEVTGCGTWSGWANWAGAPGYATTDYSTPSVANTLQPDAEYGSDTVSVAFTFSD
jgi:hypothetical protein